MNDLDLLQEYLRENSQEAFAQLVRRYANLVYSAARRQTPSAHLAEDVTQAVFAKLARHGHRLKPGTPLAAWLHLVTRRMAINSVRSEARRQAQEAAAGSIAAMNSSSSNWKQIEPVLDEAVNALPVQDRAAILLRYFDNRSLREVGASLGISDDTAQKRISRALERMRGFLARRGVTVSSTALGTGLSAHVLESAPATLVSSLTTGSLAAATGPVSAAVLETARIFAMSTLQKSVLAVALAAAIGLSIHEFSQTRLLNREISAWSSRAAAARNAHGQLQGERESIAAWLTQLRASAAGQTTFRPVEPIPPEMESALLDWLEREALLRKTLAENPQWRIPEMQLLTRDDWTTVAETAGVDDLAQIRQALGSLRLKALSAFMRLGTQALKDYAADHGGLLPQSPLELTAYLPVDLDPGILARYEMIRNGPAYDQVAASGVTSGSYAIAGRAWTDLEYDFVLRFGPGGANFRSSFDHSIDLAKAAYAAAHPGSTAPTADQLLPYFPEPVDPVRLARYMQ